MTESDNKQERIPDPDGDKCPTETPTVSCADQGKDTEPSPIHVSDSGNFRISKRSSSHKKAKKKKEKKKRTRKQKILRALTILFCTLLVLVVLFAAALFVLFKYYYGMLDYSELFSGEDTWVGQDISDEEDMPEEIDQSLMASDEEKDRYLEQIEQVGSGNFDLEIKKIGGTLGTVERDYACEYISYNDDVINILLIGLDSRYNVNVGLSDVMMVVSICPSAKKIVLTSFLRDTYVMIPGYGGNRLNAAYSYGGPSLLVETIEKNFGLRIDRYATSNFFAFVEVADYIGKVKIYLNENELRVINDHIFWTNQILYKNQNKEYLKKKDRLENKGAGYYELNGVQALAYARIRKVDNDFGRTNRQRTVMVALYNEVKEMSPIEWNEVLKKILPMITTNLTESDILKIMLNIGAYMKYDTETISVPPADNYRYMMIGNRAVIGVDINYIKQYLKDNIYS